MRRTSTFASVVNAIADEQTYTDENGTARNGMKNNDCEKKINNSGFTSCRDSTCWADATEATAAGCRVAAAAIILLLLLLLLLLPYHYNIIIITITITIIYYYRCCTMTPPPRAYIRCTVVGASVGRTAGPPAKRLRIPPPPPSSRTTDGYDDGYGGGGGWSTRVRGSNRAARLAAVRPRARNYP